MGTISFRIVKPTDPPFADQSMLDACIDPQYNGVFPDDPSLGIVEAISAREAKLAELNDEANG